MRGKTKLILVRIIVGGLIVLFGMLLNRIISPEWNFGSVGTWGFLLLIFFVSMFVFLFVENSLDDEYFVCTLIMAICSSLSIFMILVNGTIKLINMLSQLL